MTAALKLASILAADVADHIVLPEIISKGPLGPSVRKDDIQLFKIVQ